MKKINSYSFKWNIIDIQPWTNVFQFYYKMNNIYHAHANLLTILHLENNNYEIILMNVFMTQHITYLKQWRCSKMFRLKRWRCISVVMMVHSVEVILSFKQWMLLAYFQITQQNGFGLGNCHAFAPQLVLCINKVSCSYLQFDRSWFFLSNNKLTLYLNFICLNIFGKHEWIETCFGTNACFLSLWSGIKGNKNLPMPNFVAECRPKARFSMPNKRPWVWTMEL